MLKVDYCAEVKITLPSQ